MSMSTVTIPRDSASFVANAYEVRPKEAEPECQVETGFFGPPMGLASTYNSILDCQLGAGSTFPMAVKNMCEMRKSETTSKCRGLAFNPPQA